jgi:hypothetical protein
MRIILIALALLLAPSIADASPSLAGIQPQLAHKVREIVHACHARINSTFRPHARVAGSGRMSLHAVHKAVDVSGNYRCIYAHLRGWPSYSIDPQVVHHVHISIGGHEGHFRHHVGHRYAWRHRHRG